MSEPGIGDLTERGTVKRGMKTRIRKDATTGHVTLAIPPRREFDS